jgi:hypothetical protein
VDEKNGLYCDIKFSEGAGMLIGRHSKPTDYFEYFNIILLGEHCYNKIKLYQK